jgi:hypothetical protein
VIPSLLGHTATDRVGILIREALRQANSRLDLVLTGSGTGSRSGRVKPLPTRQFIRETETGWSRVRVHARLSRNAHPSRHFSMNVAVFSVLEVLTLRLYDALARRSGSSDHADCQRFGVLASFFSGVNAAYLLNPGIGCHQSTTLAAWLGVLHRGRSALMPLFIAETILSNGEDTRISPTYDPVLKLLLDVSIGQSVATRKASAVLRSGMSRKVSPGRFAVSYEQARLCSSIIKTMLPQGYSR